MPTILLTNHYEGIPYNILKSNIPDGFELIVLDNPTREDLLINAPKADYFLVSGRLHIDNDVLDSATNLKMIQRTGVGLDIFNLEELKKRNIPLYVNQGVNAQSVAEHAVLLILACLKKLTVINNNVKNGVWEKQEQGLSTFELSGKTVGLVGIGNIGKRVATILNTFGAKVLYYDEYAPNCDIAEKVDLETLYAKSDIISLHCPLTDETRAMINQKSISMMKDNAIIVNTSRGPLVNTADLISAIKSGKISFAGLDVYEEEPVKNDELLSLDNVITTPHIGGVSYDSFNRMMAEAINNINLFDQGRLDEIEKSKYL